MSEQKQDHLETLLKEFVEQRDAIKLMIVDLERVKSKIETILPDSVDKRFMRFFEEKVKTITELFRVILDMRKEIIKNSKDEIELRKKFIGTDDDDIDIEGIFNIKKIAERVEKLRKEKIGLEQTLVLPPPKEENYKSDDVTLKTKKFEVSKENEIGEF